jgi:hypothetical protein
MSYITQHNEDEAEVHTITGHEDPEGSRGIALLFL